jgi:hypothetical protein
MPYNNPVSSKKISKDEVYKTILNSCIYNAYNKENKILGNEKINIILNNLAVKLANYLTLNTYLDFNNYLICEDYNFSIDSTNSNTYLLELKFHLIDQITGKIIDNSYFELTIKYIIINQLKNKILMNMELTNLEFVN